MHPSQKTEKKITKLIPPQLSTTSRVHYEQHYDIHHLSFLEAPPPTILGHHNPFTQPLTPPTGTTTQFRPNLTISITPTAEEIIQYLEDNSLHHTNLQNFSILP